MTKKSIVAVLFIMAVGIATVFAGGSRSLSDYYLPVQPPQPTENGDRIEVLELFWYGCPHCYSLEPYLEHWAKKKPDNVEFRRVPAVLGKNWIPHARAFYTAKELGIVDEIHGPLFDAIHKQKRNINSEDSLRNFFAEHGVDEDEFTRIYNSDKVQDQLKEAFLTGKNYKITGVPSVVVNGKYLTGSALAGSNQNLITVINRLIEKESGTQ